MSIYEHDNKSDGERLSFVYEGGGFMAVQADDRKSRVSIHEVHLHGLATALAEAAGLEVSTGDSEEVKAANIIAAAIRESSGSDPVLRARALTAERALAKCKDDRDALQESLDFYMAEATEAKAELDRARDAAVRLENELAQSPRYERGAVAEAVREFFDETNVDIFDSTIQDLMAALDRVLPMAEMPDPQPTYSVLRDWLAEYQRCAVTDLYVEEVETLAVGLAENVPGLVRPDDPAPTEQDDTPSEWAPGTDITDRVESGDFPPRGTWVKASDPRLGDLSLYRKETGTMWSVGLAAPFPIGPLDGITLTVATPEELAAAGIEVAK